MSADLGVKRTAEIEEPSNRYFIHPLSRRLVDVFAALGVHPNAVSIAGMFVGAMAAVAYFHYSAWQMAVLGFGLMVLWHVLDGADGQLARLTGRTSEIGRMLDGICDHATFALVYISLAWAASLEMGPWVWVMALLAGVSHAVQASAFEYQRQSYDLWVHGKASARFVTPDEVRAAAKGSTLTRRMMSILYAGYLRLQRHMAVGDAAVMSEMSHGMNGQVHPRARAAYRDINVAGVRRWSLLSSNYRTLAIFVACLAGNPVYFFLYELVVLNVAFACLRVMQERHNQELVDELRGAPGRVAYPISSKAV